MSLSNYLWKGKIPGKLRFVWTIVMHNHWSVTAWNLITDIVLFLPQDNCVTLYIEQVRVNEPWHSKGSFYFGSDWGFWCIQKIHSARGYAMMGAAMLKRHQFVQSLWALYRLVVSSITWGSQVQSLFHIFIFMVNCMILGTRTFC